MAGWQSGYAAACKAVYAGSIPTPASIFRRRCPMAHKLNRPGGEIGRHEGLEIEERMPTYYPNFFKLIKDYEKIHIAGWQSGYAAACKAVYAGSIPTPASTCRRRRPTVRKLNRPGGEIGRHEGLKILCLNRRAGSSPALGTTLYLPWRLI